VTRAAVVVVLNGSKVYWVCTVPAVSLNAIVLPKASVSSVRVPITSVRVNVSSMPSPVSKFAVGVPLVVKGVIGAFTIGGPIAAFWGLLVCVYGGGATFVLIALIEAGRNDESLLVNIEFALRRVGAMTWDELRLEFAPLRVTVCDLSRALDRAISEGRVRVAEVEVAGPDGPHRTNFYSSRR
jgi:hypothetical protein